LHELALLVGLGIRKAAAGTVGVDAAFAPSMGLPVASFTPSNHPGGLGKAGNVIAAQKVQRCATSHGSRPVNRRTMESPWKKRQLSDTGWFTLIRSAVRTSSSGRSAADVTRPHPGRTRRWRQVVDDRQSDETQP
jgi:hypothetical protein